MPGTPRTLYTGNGYPGTVLPFHYRMSGTESTTRSEASDASTTPTFHLQCTDCSFELSIEVGSLDALEIADSHQAEYADTAAGHREHFVTITNDKCGAYSGR